MKAQDLQFTQLLEGSKQFIIPIFQRTYSWEESHCQQLWDDILRVGKSPDQRETPPDFPPISHSTTG